MSMFTIYVSCLTTSNLSWLTDLTFQVPMQCYSLWHQFTYTSRYIHSWAYFALQLSFFIPSAALSPLFSSSILDTYWPGGFIFQCYIFLPFQYCSLGSQGKNAEVVCHSLLHWTTFCQNSPPWPVRLGWPYTVWLVVSLNYAKLWWMWSFLLVFCDCDFQSVCLGMDEDNRLCKLPDGRGWLLYYTEGFHG